MEGRGLLRPVRLKIRKGTVRAIIREIGLTVEEFMDL